MRTRRSQSSGDQVLPSASKTFEHQSVLLHEAVSSLAIQKSDVVLDATLGGAGHSLAIAQLLDESGTLIGFDLDHDAIERAKARLAEVKPRVHLVEANFRNLKRELEALGITRIAKALFDLGWSSYQLDSGRGFSIQADEPLVMTYSKEGNAITAATVVNEWQEQNLADVIYGFGGERYARVIARAICERRAAKPFTTSRELAEFIKSAVPLRYRFGRIHPATRTFQAIRIAVNDELGAISEGLRDAWDMLDEGGRIAVITFHSLEDRIVKEQFVAWEKSGFGKRIGKKPLSPSEEERATNPRSRSAKLRVIEKISYDQTSQNKQIQPLDFSGET